MCFILNESDLASQEVNRRTRRRYHNGTGDSLSLQWGASDHRCCNFLISGGKVLQSSREDLVSVVLRERLVRWEVSERGRGGRRRDCIGPGKSRQSRTKWKRDHRVCILRDSVSLLTGPDFLLQILPRPFPSSAPSSVSPSHT